GDARDGATREHAVGDVGVYVGRALFDQRVGGIHQRAARVDDVVDQDAGRAGDFTDHVHHLGFAGALAPLVDDGERRIDALGKAARAHDAADVGRHDRDVAALEALLDVARHHG